jgi:endonuclease YncB( thermonuclease family)
VYRADGTLLNAALVANGYAHTMIIRPNVRHAKKLKGAATPRAVRGTRALGGL